MDRELEESRKRVTNKEKLRATQQSTSFGTVVAVVAVTGTSDSTALLLRPSSSSSSSPCCCCTVSEVLLCQIVNMSLQSICQRKQSKALGFRVSWQLLSQGTDNPTKHNAGIIIRKHNTLTSTNSNRSKRHMLVFKLACLHTVHCS